MPAASWQYAEIRKEEDRADARVAFAKKEGAAVGDGKK